MTKAIIEALKSWKEAMEEESEELLRKIAEVETDYQKGYYVGAKFSYQQHIDELDEMLNMFEEDTDWVSARKEFLEDKK